MPADLPDHGMRITSTLEKGGTLVLELVDAPVVRPGPDEIVLRVEATPINPSDLVTMLPAVDPVGARFEGTRERPKVTLQLPRVTLGSFTGRLDLPLPVGLVGAGTVVATGERAQHLLGKNVTAMSMSGGMYAEYQTVMAAACTPLPEGVTAAQGADVFCNPMTALAMIETLRLEGYKSLIHTAAASNLGQMLVKICREDGIPLVAIVRREEQADLLRDLGAAHVCNSSAPGFREDLVRAIAETGATVAFDAVGGGDMAHQLLSAMESAAVSRLPEFSPYGSSERKQVYLYGHLDGSPPFLNPSEYGMLWDIGGWAMPPIMDKVGADRVAELLHRVLTNIRTTFASTFCREISLAEVLQRETMIAYHRRATGEKFLINPQR